MINDDTSIMLHQSAVRAAKTGRPVCSRFIAAAEESIARHEAKENGLNVEFSGGWNQAERVQACFFDDGDPEFTLVWVRITWAEKFVSCDHRMLMGSLMALGIDRSYFGDLIVGDGEAVGCGEAVGNGEATLSVMPEVADRLESQWTKAGNCTIAVKKLTEPPEIKAPQGRIVTGTVSSLRLDSILAAGTNVSRSRAAEMIRSGGISVDHMAEERTDRMLTQGQLISVRGFGRIRLKEVGTVTRKDRQRVVLEIFHNDK